MLRNLRNMQKVDVPDEVIRQALNDNPFKRVLPFRFISAAKFAPKFGNKALGYGHVPYLN